jgi:Tfp pilus assembly protein PilX
MRQSTDGTNACLDKSRENGSIIVIVVVILMMLTVIGISLTTTASIELQIAGNHKLHKRAFYRADGALEVAAEMAEQNLGCMSGFTANDGSDAVIGDDANKAVRVTNLAFWQKVDATVPSDGNRDFYIPNNYGSAPHTNITVGGNSAYSSGSAIQMVSGYEGKGKGSGAGGSYILYDVYAQHVGVSNSEAVVMAQWRHVIGQEGACNY